MKFFTLLGLILLLAPTCLTAQNLIVNGGFETATVPMPTGTPIPSYPNELDDFTAVNVDGEFIFDLTKAHSGTGFLSVLQNAGQNPLTTWLGVSSFAGYDRAGQLVTVSPNTQYQLTFWYKYGDGTRYGYSTGDVWLNIEQTLPSNVSVYTQQIPTTSNWQQYTYTFTTGATASEIIILFSGVDAGNVDVWIDDVELYGGCIIHTDLGADTSICTGETLLLDASGDTSITTYQWQDNSTNPTFNVTQPGTYWVIVGNGTCNDTDSIVVNYNLPPVVDLGNDTALCTGETLTKNVTTQNGTYQWQDNSTGPSYQITQAGTYWVILTVGGCSNSDTIVVDYGTSPTVQLQNDTTVCEGTPIIIDATTPNVTYLWQDGSTGATYEATQAGIYWVEVINNNCSDRDSVVISYDLLPTVDLGEDTALCEDDSLLLNVENTNATYLWQDSSTNATLIVADSGMYWVKVTLNNCSKTDTVVVTIKECKVELAMPNVFTPNADGTNDFFHPLDFKGISEATLIIYNRWGLKIFESNDAATGWDGTFNGNYCAQGTYYWVLPYTDIFNNSETLTGFLTLTQ